MWWLAVCVVVSAYVIHQTRKNREEIRAIYRANPDLTYAKLQAAVDEAMEHGFQEPDEFDQAA